MEPLSKRQKTEEDVPDFTIEVKGVPFRIRKRVLEAESGYMKLKLLYMSEEETTLEIQDENPMCICKCLSFIEGKRISGGSYLMWPLESSLTCIDEIISHFSEVPPLLDLAYRWEISRLQTVLFDYIHRHLHLDSFYRFSFLAQEYNNISLQTHCVQFLVRNFCQLCPDFRFLQLDQNLILSALKSPNFETSCWDTVYEAILKWTKQTEERINFFEELFLCVNLTTFSPDYLETQVENNMLVKHNPTCQRKVHKAYRKIYEESEAIIISRDSASTVDVRYPLCKRSFNLKRDCRPEEDMMAGYSLIVFRDHLYVFHSNQSVFRLAISHQRPDWKRIASTNDYHDSKPSAANLNGDLLVFGGGRVMINSCEKYDAQHNTWLRIAILNLKTELYSIAVARGFIYVIGVVTEGVEFFSSVEKFDPTHNSVTYVPPMKYPVVSPATAVSEEKIYVIGQEAGSIFMNIECLDTITNTWATIVGQGQGVLGVSSAWITQNTVCCLGQLPSDVSGMTCVLGFPTNCSHVKSLTIDRTSFHTAAEVVHCGTLKTYDVIIKVGEKEFPAHKSILSRVSDYFRAMFSCEMIENQTGIVDMKSIDSCVVRKCIDNAYDTSLPDLSNENIEDFVQAATRMQIPGILKVLTGFLIKNLSIHTFEFTKTLSNKYGCFEVEDACDDFATKNFAAIVRSSCFWRMEKDYVAFLIKHRETKENDEWMAFDSIMRWIMCGLAVSGFKIDQYFSELFGLLNLIRIPEDTVKTTIANATLVKNSPSCYQKVQDSLKKRKELHEVLCIMHYKEGRLHLKGFQPELEKWTDLWSGDAKHGIMSCARAIGFTVNERYFYRLDYDGFIEEFQYRDAKAGWEVLSEVRTEHNERYFGQQQLHMVGDSLFILRSKSFEEYNTVTKKWRTIRTKLKKTNFTAVVVDKNIFVMGGCDYYDDMATTTTQCFDTRTNSLNRKLANMYHSRCDAAAVHFDGKIYISGGWYDEGDEPRAEVEYYNIEADAWTMFRDMNYPRHEHGACVVGGKMYVVGGDENTPQTMEYYDEIDDAWKIRVLTDITTTPDLITAGHIPYERLV